MKIKKKGIVAIAKKLKQIKRLPIPLEYKKGIISNTIAQHGRGVYGITDVMRNGHIRSAFVFKNTPEGHDYWVKYEDNFIYKKINIHE